LTGRGCGIALAAKWTGKPDAVTMHVTSV